VLDADRFEQRTVKWSVKADLLQRMRRFAEAESCYRHALDLVGTEPERRFLQRRIAGIKTGH